CNISARVVGDARGLSLYVLHQAVEVVTRVRNGDHSNRRPVPQSAGIQFGGGNVEAGPQPVFEATDHLPLVFEGLSRFDVQFEGEKSNHSSRQSSVISRQRILKTGDRRLTTA